MDHPFLSQRALLVNATRAQQLGNDVCTLLSMDVKDHALIKQRKEPEVSPPVENALNSCVHRLGMVLTDITALTEHAKDLAPTHGDTWAQFLQCHDTDTSALRATMNTLLETLASDVQRIRQTECDDDSSSYSDYSDSRTVTTDGENSSSETDEGEGSDTDEGEGSDTDE